MKTGLWYVEFGFDRKPGDTTNIGIVDADYDSSSVGDNICTRSASKCRAFGIGDGYKKGGEAGAVGEATACFQVLSWTRCRATPLSRPLAGEAVAGAEGAAAAATACQCRRTSSLH